MKTALVTGAFSAIGLEICRVLSLRGYKLICQYANNSKGRLLKEKGIDFASVISDFSSHKSVVELVDFIDKQTNSLDVIVHCASKHEKLMTSSSEEIIFNTVAHVNLFAPVFITNRLIDKMRMSDNPVIIFISSTYAKQLGSTKNIYYASTKTALHTVSRILARELPPVRSNVIMPGYVDTPSYRLGRTDIDIERDKQLSLNKTLVSAQDIADATLFIIDNRLVNGSVVTVDGGLNI
jgi:3-oxoacyl-[acyl-carrier protein] reductase